MRQAEIDEPLEITTIGDVPAGTGMGSSSSLTVGLLNALYAYRHRIVSPRLLAEQACRIEIDLLNKPIGRQDQYAAAFGGINYIRFNSDDTMDIEPFPCRAETLTELEQRTLLLFTGQTRDANRILERQSSGTADRMEVLRQMRDLSAKMRLPLTGEGDLDQFAALLHEGWELKRSLGFGISNDQVNEWYEAARKAGAPGGKRRRRRWRLLTLDRPSVAAPGNPRSFESPSRASIPYCSTDYSLSKKGVGPLPPPPWQPEYLHPQLKTSFYQETAPWPRFRDV